jgi:hypothetical protein
MNNEQIPQELENFINRNRKICWEAEFEQGEFCIGENKVIDFFNQYLSQSSQPKGAEEGAGSAEEVLAEVIGEVLYSELTRRSAMPQYPTTQLQLILKAMQSYASQQCAEKDKEIAELKAAVSKQDEMIGRLTRERDNLRDTEDKRQEWLDKAKSDFGVHRNTSFDEVWAKTLSAYKENENLKAELKKSQQPEVNRLGEIVGTFPDLPPYEKDNTTQQQPEVSEDWKNKFREFCASHEGNKSGDLRVMHVEAVINWIERNQLFEPQPVQGESGKEIEQLRERVKELEEHIFRFGKTYSPPKANK